MDALTVITCVYFAVFAIAAWRTWHYAGKYDNEKRWPLRKEYRKRMNPQKSIIKIARRLVNRIYYVLKHEKEYVPCVV